MSQSNQAAVLAAFVLATMVGCTEYVYPSDADRVAKATIFCQKHGGLIAYDGLLQIDDFKCSDGFTFRGHL